MLKGLFGKRKSPAPLPDDADTLVGLSGRLTDPWERRRCLDKAAELAPDSLLVQRAVLMLGGLGMPGSRPADFSLIKSWLLTAFERPEDFSEQKRREMIREIFDHPQLRLCLSLADDPDAFTDAYVKDLAREYCRLFISGSSRHSGAVFGISTEASRLRGASAPLGGMLENISACPYLSGREREMLLRHLYAEARTLLRDEMDLVHEYIGPELTKELTA